eukprot:9258349-Alexandrium_andersonii.AAC.1
MLGLPELLRVREPHGAIARQCAGVPRDHRRVLNAVLSEVTKPLLGQSVARQRATASARADIEIAE